MFGTGRVGRLAQPRATVAAHATDAPATSSAAKKYAVRVWHRAHSHECSSTKHSSIYTSAVSFFSSARLHALRRMNETEQRAAHLAVAADARPFAGPAAEPPRFSATRCVALPRAERRARLNRKSVMPT